MMDKDQKADPVASNHGRVAHIEGLSRCPPFSHIIPNRPHPPNFPKETQIVKLDLSNCSMLTIIWLIC